MHSVHQTNCYLPTSISSQALIVFKGNYELEQRLPLDVSPWEDLNITTCHNCTMNSFALQVSLLDLILPPTPLTTPSSGLP